MLNINNLNKQFESRVRLGIMSVLMVNDWVDFSEMKELLKITDGNLASHSTALEKANYIKIKKEFVAKNQKLLTESPILGGLLLKNI
jgi:hypothetical protein